MVKVHSLQEAPAISNISCCLESFAVLNRNSFPLDTVYNNLLLWNQFLFILSAWRSCSLDTVLFDFLWSVYKLVIFISGTSFARDFHLGVQILGRAKDSSYHLIAMTPYNRTRVLHCQKVTVLFHFVDSNNHTLWFLDFYQSLQATEIPVKSMKFSKFPKQHRSPLITLICEICWLWINFKTRGPLNVTNSSQSWLSICIHVCCLTDVLYIKNSLQRIFFTKK